MKLNFVSKALQIITIQELTTMIEIQIFGTTKCKESQKALRFFKERNIKTHFIDLTEKPLAKRELESILVHNSAYSLIDTNSKAYKDGQYQFINYDPLELIQDKPAVIKTPIVRTKGKSTVGIQESIWKEWISNK